MFCLRAVPGGDTMFVGLRDLCIPPGYIESRSVWGHRAVFALES